MAPTSVIPFHFLTPNHHHHHPSSPTTTPFTNSNGITPISSSNPAALFASSPFDDSDHFPSHHHRFPPQHQHYTTTTTTTTGTTTGSNNSPIQQSPSTPRLAYPLHHHHQQQQQSSPRWETAASNSNLNLDGVSRDPPQAAFTLPPITTPRTTTSLNTTATTPAGSEWDSDAAQYAAAQWGAYTTSPGQSLFQLFPSSVRTKFSRVSANWRKLSNIFLWNKLELYENCPLRPKNKTSAIPKRLFSNQTKPT